MTRRFATRHKEHITDLNDNMNRIKSLYHSILGAAGLLLLVSCGQTKPGFAIIIDPQSYIEAQAEINRYLEVVESRGLHPFLVIDSWGVPDSIRAELMRLHANRSYPIEGCVLIGDIPVAMVRDAQHFTTALKMDQFNPSFSRNEYCVPSDRFYDCFDLKFDLIEQDSARSEYFFYSLRGDCPQRLRPTIYSARIMPRDNEPGSKYDKLRRYMQRVNEADSNNNPLDRMFYFSGEGYISESVDARIDEKIELYDQFPWMRTQQQSIEYIDHKREKFVKNRLMQQMQYRDVDFAILHHHGAFDTEYLSVYPEAETMIEDVAMMRRFMIESVKYWINEYHIDGFRFDLMGCHDIETMNQVRKAVDKIDPTIFIYGEGWSAGQCAYPQEKLGVKANTALMPRIAAFSDELRDGLRGPFSDDTKGAFLAGLQGEEESIKFGIAGCIDHPQVDMQKVNYSKKAWATDPTQMISYVSCHDDMCLVDRLKASIPGINTDEIIRLDLLAQTAVFTSQGVPFMLSGEEMLRDKKGVHNSFESPDSINHLDWDNLKKYPQVFQYYKNLIQLRKDHPAFRLGSADLVRKHLEFLDVTNYSSPVGEAGVGSPLIAFRLKDYAGGDKWRDIYVFLNANREPVKVSLPYGSYETVCDDGRISETGIRHFTGDQVTIAPQSALILHN